LHQATHGYRFALEAFLLADFCLHQRLIPLSTSALAVGGGALPGASFPAPALHRSELQRFWLGSPSRSGL
jgi:hypothetical protein